MPTTTKARKTYAVDDLRVKVNNMIAASKQNDPDNKSARYALSVLVETVLHETGNYKGFRFLDGHEAAAAGTEDRSAVHYF